VGRRRSSAKPGLSLLVSRKNDGPGGFGGEVARGEEEKLSKARFRPPGQ